MKKNDTLKNYLEFAPFFEYVVISKFIVGTI